MKLSDRIRYVGVRDFRPILFENQWPIPEGISYNSYLIIDEKIALIDTVESAFTEEFFSNIDKEIGERGVDYLIVNHMEPDHSASVSAVRKRYPECAIVTNAKALPMLEGYQGVTDGVLVVKEGETLSLGESTLSFHMIPMVHWPETMVTYYREEKTAFTGDAFGSFKAAPLCVSDSKTDLFEEYEAEMRRYYASIVGKYGSPVQSAIKKLGSLEINRICSTHGPVWEREIAKVLDLYIMLSSYKALSHGVCLAYASMYGNTRKAAKALAAELDKRGIPYGIHDLCAENISFALADAFKYDTIVIGAPTYNNGIFPAAKHFAEAICDRCLKNRSFAAFGSYTWAGTSVKKLNEIAAAQGFAILGEGISFRQGFDMARADMSSIASLVETSAGTR